MWISVSQNFKEQKIMGKMLKNLGEVSIGNDGELLMKTHHHLLGKSHLLVLDDV